MMKGLEKEERSKGHKYSGFKERVEGILFNVLKIYGLLYWEW